MSQRHKGIEHNKADCPKCGRSQVAGGIDHETGHIILRYHKTKPRGPWCSNRTRVDAGPASPLLAHALDIARRNTR